MLILTRRYREAVVIGGFDGFDRVLKITIFRIRGGRVQLGFEADGDIPIRRFELYERIKAGSQPDKLTAGSAVTIDLRRMLGLETPGQTTTYHRHSSCGTPDSRSRSS